MYKHFTRESLNFYSLDFNNPKFNYSNSLLCSKKNYRFLSILKNTLSFKIKLKKVDVLINIENYTHLREINFIVNFFQKYDYNILIQSANLDLHQFFIPSPKTQLLCENKFTIKYYLKYILNFLFNPFFYQLKNKITNSGINLRTTQLLNNKSKYLYFKLLYNFILNSSKPKYCIVGNDLTFHGRLLTIEAKNFSKTFSFQHGNIYDDYKTRNHITENFLCYSLSSKKILKKYFHGNLFLTGSCFHKYIINSKRKLFEKFIETLPFKKYTLIAFSGHGHSTNIVNYKKQIDCIQELSTKFTSRKFIIKLHPKENIIFYKSLINKKNIFIINQTNVFNIYSIYPLLENADKLITGISTTSIEAMVKKIPVICLDPESEYKRDFLVRNSYVNYANSFKKLTNLYSSDNYQTEKSYNFSVSYFGLKYNLDLQNIFPL